MCKRRINRLPLTRPQPGTWPTTRHVPWPGIELLTFWFSGWQSIHWATPAGLKTYFLKIYKLYYVLLMDYYYIYVKLAYANINEMIINSSCPVECGWVGWNVILYLKGCGFNSRLLHILGLIPSLDMCSPWSRSILGLCV